MKTGNERRTVRKVLLVIGILAAVLIPATAASAQGQSWGSRGQSWGARPAAASTPCGQAASHFWCGTNDYDGQPVDRTFHWWELGLDKIVNHGHVPEQTFAASTSISDPGRPCSPWRPCDNGNLIQPHIICWHVDGANTPCWTGSPFSWIPWVW